jgi:hypothetical protein
MSKKDALSIKDIARSAQVSHSTVFTRAAEQPARQCGYGGADPSHRRGVEFPRQRRRPESRHRRTIPSAWSCPRFSDPFMAEVVGGLEEVTNARGYSLMLATSAGDPDREIKIVRVFENGASMASSLTGGSHWAPSTRRCWPP